MSSKKFQVSFVNNTLSRRGRPAFISSTTRTLTVTAGEDRRHILHGATQITDVFILALNWVIARDELKECEQLVDRLLTRCRNKNIPFMLPNNAVFVKKVEKLVTIAFSRQENLIVGSAIANQGIEKARASIAVIRNKLDKYCCIGVRTFAEILNKTITLIDNASAGGPGEISQYRSRIMRLLARSITKASDTVSLGRILRDFEFSCTLDIVHDNSTKKQNIWGINMANKVQEAIDKKSPEALFDVFINME